MPRSNQPTIAGGQFGIVSRSSQYTTHESELRRHSASGVLWRYGRVLTHNDSDADDLVQESLARALALAGSYDTSRPLMPWSITIVRNMSVTSAARADAEKRRLGAYALQSDPASNAPQGDPLDEAEAS